MTKVFGIVGWSGSGKTDIVCRLIDYYRKKNICVSSVKHTDKFSKKTEIILVEGLKTSKFPKIEVYYSKIKKPLLFPNDKNIKAVVSDKITKDLDSCKIPKLEFCNTKTIGDFIINYFRNEK